MKRILFATLFILALSGPLSAQEIPAAFSIPLPGVGSYDSAIPTPEEVIGHSVGTRHTEPHQLVAYYQAVAAASDRVVIREHGRTFEGRPLVHVLVTSPENHGRLDDIRTNHLRLSDDPSSVSDAELADMPAVAWLGYSVHGNEASGSEASLLTIYHLAAGQGPAVTEALDNAVFILDPSFNPDGRYRFAQWANQNRGRVATADPQDREHNEPWPGGRTNHYWFDLNRDWLPVQLPESRGRIELFHEWRPVVLTDHHEMGTNSNFFFQPGIPSRNNHVTPERTFELTQAIAEYHAKHFDRYGALYYAEESFDDYYYGKGSTFPDVNGAIGILFEQASSRALKRESVNGVLDYAYTVRNQFSASLSTIEAVVALREELLRHHRDFYATSNQAAQEYPTKAWVINLDHKRTRAQALIEVMLRHRIQIFELASDFSGPGGEFSAGNAVVVPMDQPQARLIRGMMEKNTTFKDSLFYDVSAWTLPLAFGVDYAEVARFSPSMSGERITEARFDGGARVGGTSEYGYLIPWGRYFAARALWRFQEAGFHPRLMEKPFSANIGGALTEFDRGTIFIPAQKRDEPTQKPSSYLERIVEEAVNLDHVEVYAVDGGFTPSGPDLGTPSASVLDQPSIAIITGNGASSYNAGQVWHLLNERFEIPVSLLDADRVGNANLDRYNTIVLAGGSYGAMPSEKVKDWVRSGGTLVTLTSASNWAVRNELVDLEPRTTNIDSVLQTLPYDQLGAAQGAQYIGGAIFETSLDTTHPLAYGHDESIPVFRSGNSFYEPSDSPGSTVGRYVDSPIMSGYISEEQHAIMGGSASLVAESLGRGNVILFMDNPNFRAFWWGTNGLFMNAIFFGSTF